LTLAASAAFNDWALHARQEGYSMIGRAVTASTGPIGQPMPRPGARRLVQGRGTYVDDVALPGMLHIAFLRSPYAHARIAALDALAARSAPGVAAVVSGADLRQHYTPWVGVLTTQPGLRSAPQCALAVDRARWQGEPVAAVVARSRAEAEDAIELIDVRWEELPAVVDAEAALRPESELIHPELGGNLAFTRELSFGDVTTAFKTAHAVVEQEFRFGRHTGVPLEARGLVADFNAADRRLTLHHSGQSPHQIQALFSRILGLPESSIRVIDHDVGGAFGIKLHVYGDEVAAAVMSILLKRPVKFIADRLEAFVSDIHARDHQVIARMAFDSDGSITAFEIDDLTGIGAYAAYPRSSVTEANMILNLSGTQYRISNYHARARVAFQNKNVMAQFRAVGLPIATAIAETLMDRGAVALGLDPVELRRRNLAPDDAYPLQSITGAKFEQLSHQTCLRELVSLMSYDELRREQAEYRRRGVQRGIGIAVFIEGTGPSSWTYGAGGAPISSQDGATVRLDPSGTVACSASITEQGQGTETILAQIVADAVGVDPAIVRVMTGDTDSTPYGGGAWGSRGTAAGGSAAWRAARALRDNILEVAAALIQSSPAALDIRAGEVVDAATGTARISLVELANIVYFRCHELPNSLQAELVVTRHYRLTDNTYIYVNGVHGSYVEVDTDTGIVRPLRHWVVGDCGRVINPLLVDEQVRGGVVQGIGMALFEHCIYDSDGQLCNGTLADYLLPTAAEMPDILCAHVQTPSPLSPIGAKGAGESGLVAAPAAIMNAVNDALLPFNARIADTPITPRVVLRALGRIAG
jgi:aerobic carbon-monoxide dehydrogenase large subunit